MVDPVAAPISSVEAQAVLGLTRSNYDAAVSAGLLSKSRDVEGRSSIRTAQHAFLDLMSFVLTMQRDDWGWVVSADDIDLILNKLHDQHVAHFDPQDRRDYFSQVGRLSDVALGGEASPEYQDALRAIIRRIEHIWAHLLRQIEIELSSDKVARPSALSAESFMALQKQVLLTVDQWHSETTASP